jgi:hypothetical protein
MLLMTASSALRCSVSFEQSLRLVEQARALERDAHARRDGVEQSQLASPNAYSRSWSSTADRAEHRGRPDDRDIRDRPWRGRCRSSTSTPSAIVPPPCCRWRSRRVSIWRLTTGLPR